MADEKDTPNASVTTFAGGDTGLTPSEPTSGDVVLGGVLKPSAGGTGVTASTGDGGFAMLSIKPHVKDILFSGNSTGNVLLRNTSDKAESYIIDLPQGSGTLALQGSGGGGTFSAGDTGLTPVEPTQDAVLGGTLAAKNGGTGYDVYRPGDMLFAATSTFLTKLSAGKNGQYLTLNNGFPYWTSVTPGGAGVASFSTGKTGLQPTQPTLGDVVLDGVLNVEHGGTGTTTATGTGPVVLGENPTIDEVILTRADLGTPSRAVLTNATGLPLETGVVGNLPVKHLDGGNGASDKTYWRGDGTWDTPQGTGGDVIVDGVPVKGQMAQWTGDHSIKGIDVTGSGNAVLQDKPTLTAGALFNTFFEQMTVVTEPPLAFVVNFDVKTQKALFLSAGANRDFALNFRGDGGSRLDNFMSLGQSLTVVFLIKNGGRGHYPKEIDIDNTKVQPLWAGGFPPIGGSINAVDVYEFNIIKTSFGQFTVIASVTKYATEEIPFNGFDKVHDIQPVAIGLNSFSETVACSRDGTFVIMGTHQYMSSSDPYYAFSFVSEDGINWSDSYHLPEGIVPFHPREVIATPTDLFVCLGNNPNYGEPMITSSIDGRNWTVPKLLVPQKTVLSANALFCDFNGRLVALTKDGTSNLWSSLSTNAVDWTPFKKIEGTSGTVFFGCSTLDNKLVAVGCDANGAPAAMVSETGFSWTPMTAMGGETRIISMTGVAINRANKLVAVGNASFQLGSFPAYAVSYDGGYTWSKPNYINTATTDFQIGGIACDRAGRFVVTGYATDKATRRSYPVYTTSMDGENWETIARMPFDEDPNGYIRMYETMCNLSGRFVSVGWRATNNGQDRYTVVANSI